MLSDNAKAIYKRLYLAEGETSPTDVHARVAKFVASREENDADRRKFEELYFNLLEENKFRPNSPTMMNGGILEKPILSACFVSHLEDDLISILDFDREAAIIFSYGAGIGINWGVLREEGAELRTGGSASGPISFMRKLNATADCVKSGGRARRAAIMSILDVDHLDIFDFIACKDDLALAAMNLSLAATDEFMEAVARNADWQLRGRGPIDAKIRTVKAREIFDKACEMAHKTGDPGLFFIDRANEFNPAPKTLGKIRATNPCLRKGTLLFDGDRLRPVECTDAKTFVSWKTGEKECVRLHLSDGGYIDLTPDHEVWVEYHGWTPAAETQGKLLLTKDAERRRVLNEFQLKKHLDEWVIYGKQVSTSGLFPSWVLRRRWDKLASFLRGFFSEHWLSEEDAEEGRLVFNIPFSHLIARDAKRALSLFGIRSTVVQREYLKSQIRIYDATLFFSLIGIVDFDQTQYAFADDDHQVWVTKVEEIGTYEVYDFSMKDGLPYNLAEGIIVHNCGEQALHPYGSCNLGSMNLAKYVPKDKSIVLAEEFEHDVFVATRFLDSIIDLSGYPTPDYERVAKHLRPIGLGLMGLADYFLMLGVPYGSQESIQLAEKIAELLTHASITQSMYLGEIRGSCRAFEEEPDIGNFVKSKFGFTPDAMRNGQWTTIAPTGSISLSADCSQGLEPYFAIAYAKTLTDTNETLYIVSPGFEKLYANEPWYNKALIQISEHRGSCQKVDCVPDSVKRVAICAHDLHYRQRLHIQAALQKYISNAISSTVNLPSTTTVDDVKEIYMKAWELGLKGITIYRDGSKEGQPIDFGKTKKESRPKGRPQVLYGATHKVQTPSGSIYITVNRDETGKIVEVFTNGGKNGSVSAANLEAIARLISVALQEGTPLERLVSTISGIYDRNVTWVKLSEEDEKAVQITSIPDAVAKVLARFYLDDKCSTNIVTNSNTQCPDCGGPAFMSEGCLLCPQCGSKCG